METDAETLPPVPLATRLRAGAGRLARRLSRFALDLALPPACMACRAAVDEPGCLCGACWRQLAFIDAPKGSRHGLPLRGLARYSVDGLIDPPAYDRARAAVEFGPVARDLVHGLKYADRQELGAPLARMMARTGRDILKDAHALIPVPLHAGRLWQRRFNQSAVLAKHVARESGVPMRASWLIRARATIPQVGLDREARAANVAGAFRVPEGMDSEVSGRRLVLVDDVLTTGATIDACAKALSRAGASQVDVLVFARVVDGSAGAIS